MRLISITFGKISTVINPEELNNRDPKEAGATKHPRLLITYGIAMGLVLVAIGIISIPDTNVGFAVFLGFGGLFVALIMYSVARPSLKDPDRAERVDRRNARHDKATLAHPWRILYWYLPFAALGIGGRTWGEIGGWTSFIVGSILGAMLALTFVVARLYLAKYRTRKRLQLGATDDG